MSKKALGVHSEAGKLHKVMVCSPGLAHLRLTPNNCDELLFDDVIWVSQAKRDHFDFMTKMRERGIEVVEMHNLLEETVKNPEALKWILDRKITANSVGLGLQSEVRSFIEGLEARKVAEFLIGGVSGADLAKHKDSEAAKMFNAYLGESSFLFPPLPNTQFTRDTTCWIYGGVTLNPMYWPARRQETLLTTAIYKFHPEFVNADFEVWYGDPDKDHGQATLEGGDIMPVGNGTMLIGLFLGFMEIGRLPHFVAVQSSKCAPLYEAYHEVPASPKRTTIAEAIRITKPKRLKEMVKAIRDSGGDVITVPDKDILKAQKYLSHRGIYVEMTSAAALAGAVQFFENGKPDNYKVVIPLTGNGLKR